MCLCLCVITNNLIYSCEFIIYPQTDPSETHPCATHAPSPTLLPLSLRDGAFQCKFEPTDVS